MKLHTHRGSALCPVLHCPVRCRLASPTKILLKSRSLNSRRFLGAPDKHFHVSVSVYCRRIVAESGEFSGERSQINPAPKRRDVLVAPFLAIGTSILHSAVARADEKPQETISPPSTGMTATPPLAPDQQAQPQAVKVEEKEEEVINSRIYDATVIGEPMAVGKDKRKVWEKLMNARIVYLGEAEQVPIRDDKELELEIVKTLKKRCSEAERPISLALEAFPTNLQDQLNQYIDRKYRFS